MRCRDALASLTHYVAGDLAKHSTQQHTVPDYYFRFIFTAQSVGEGYILSAGRREGGSWHLSSGLASIMSDL